MCRRWYLAVVCTLILIGVFPLLGGPTSPSTASAAMRWDLRAFYPNTGMIGKYYLSGTNYPAGKPSSPSVLWFRSLDRWTFRQHNSKPPINCNWDQLSWWDDGFLRYVKTHEGCDGRRVTTQTYDPPIIYLPRYWTDGQSWSLSGTSRKTDTLNGSVICKGTTAYSSTILGWEEVRPGVRAIHWKVRETTTWDAFGQCRTWEKTEWEEHYWMVTDLSVKGSGPTRGIARAAGGNLANTPWDWDVWFQRWERLP